MSSPPPNSTLHRSTSPDHVVISRRVPANPHCMSFSKERAFRKLRVHMVNSSTSHDLLPAPKYKEAIHAATTPMCALGAEGRYRSPRSLSHHQTQTEPVTTPISTQTPTDAVTDMCCPPPPPIDFYSGLVDGRCRPELSYHHNNTCCTSPCRHKRNYNSHSSPHLYNNSAPLMIPPPPTAFQFSPMRMPQASAIHNQSPVRRCQSPPKHTNRYMPANIPPPCEPGWISPTRNCQQPLLPPPISAMLIPPPAQYSQQSREHNSNNRTDNDADKADFIADVISKVLQKLRTSPSSSTQPPVQLPATRTRFPSRSPRSQSPESLEANVNVQRNPQNHTQNKSRPKHAKSAVTGKERQHDDKPLDVSGSVNTSGNNNANASSKDVMDMRSQEMDLLRHKRQQLFDEIRRLDEKISHQKRKSKS